MRIVITGATGNVGTALLRRLRGETGVTEILAISRRAPDRTVEPYDGIEWKHIDVGADDARSRLTDAMRGADAVVHLAWILQPNRNERELYRVNVLGSRNVFAAAAAAGVPHLVYSSSIGAYSQGPKSRRVDETWPTGGIHTSHYSRHKAIVERLLDRTALEHPSMVTARVRPGIVFQADAGREIAHLFLGPLIPVTVLKRVRPPVVPLPGRVISQAVHANDLADALWRVLQKRATGAFNVAAEPVLAPAEVARAIGARRAIRVPLGVVRSLLWMSWRLGIQRTDPGWIDIAVYTPVMSTDRARTELGWSPATSSTDALSELVDALASRRGHSGSPSLWPR